MSALFPTTLAATLADRQAAAGPLWAELDACAAMTFTDVLRRNAVRWPDQTATIFGARTQSHSAMIDRIDRAAAALAQTGVGPGTRVALWLENSDIYFVWYLAVLGLGAVAVPMNTRLVPREAEYILTHARPALLITEPAFLQLADAAAPALARLVLDAADADRGLAQIPWQGRVCIDPDWPAAIYYTSGTTGQPKGVVHTHRSLLAIALQSAPAWEFGFPGVRCLAVTPLFHIAAHTIFFPTLLVGGTLVIDTYNTQRVLDLIRTHQISAIFSVPSILLLLLDATRARGETFPSVRSVMFGAAPMTIARLGDVQSMFPNAGLIHGMGQTESCGTLVTLPSVAAFSHAGSVGAAMAGVEAVIVDDHDRPVAPGVVGELVARGPNLMQGYLDNPEASQATLRGGWLHTGDLGFQDEHGLVTLLDRKKDMIIRGGENIYSVEVEQALLRHPAIKAAAVVGQPCAIMGEQVAAFVVADDDQPRPDTDAVIAHCRAELADYKVPVTLRFLPEMPLTATGKIRKPDLRASLPPWQPPARHR